MVGALILRHRQHAIVRFAAACRTGKGWGAVDAVVSGLATLGTPIIASVSVVVVSTLGTGGESCCFYWGCNQASTCCTNVWSSL